MARTRNWWAGQRVKESDLDGIFADMEGGDHQLAADQDLKGIITGLEVTENSPADLLVAVAAGLAFDKTGRRIKVATDQFVDLSIDADSLSTNPATGNDRYISVRVRFARQASDTQGPDLTNNFVAFVIDEFYELYTEVGAEAPTGTASPPSPHAVDLTLADVLITHNQTTVLNADISSDNREYMVDMGAAGEALQVVGGTPKAAISWAIDKINEIANGTEPVVYNGGRRHWASILDPVYTASPQSIEQCLIDLPAGLADAAGESRIGADAITVGSVLLGSGSILTHVTALISATNHSMPAAGNFTATTTSGWLTALTTTTDATHNGAYYVGVFAHGNFTGANVYAQLAELDGTGAGNDGAKRVKTEVTAQFTAGDDTTRKQLDRLSTDWGKLSRANNWTAQQTLTAPSAGNVLVLSGTDSKARFEGEVVCLDGLAVSNGTLNYFSTGTSVTSTFNGPVVISATGTITTSSAIKGYTKTNTILGTGVSVAVSASTSRFHYYTAPSDGTKYYVDDTGMENGDEIDIVFYDIGVGESVSIWSVAPPAGSARIEFGEGYGSATMRRIAGAWRLVRHSGSNPLIGTP